MRPLQASSFRPRSGRRRPAVLLALLVVSLLVTISPIPAIEAQSAPAPVASVDVTRADGTLTASWDAPAGATSYHVTYSSDNRQSWSLAALDHTETSITIVVDNGKTYIVGVRAKNEHGGSSWRGATPRPPGRTPRRRHRRRARLSRSA